MKKYISLLAAAVIIASLASAGISRSTSSCAVKKADLSIVKTSVKLDVINNKVIVNYIIKNSGKAVAKSSTTKLALSDKSGAVYDTVPGLNPGASASRTVEYIIPTKGKYDINLSADYNNKVPESNELNNQNAVRFSFGGAF